MAIATLKSDIIISIHPPHVANIVSGKKNHEFRKYLLPREVQRLWIYTTRPVSAIEYVAEISNGKQPGSITSEKGLKNKEFNQGKLAPLTKYAYEIRKLDKLAERITLKELKEKKWLNGPPQKYAYVKGPMAAALSGTRMIVVLDRRSAPTRASVLRHARADDKLEAENNSV